jgi:DNA polymerase V
MTKIKNHLKFINILQKAKLQIPYALDLIPAGFPSSAENFMEKVLSLDELMIKHPASTFFVRVLGESMKPTINNNDILVVDKSLPIANNKILVARINDEFTVKRVRIVDNQIFLIADNPEYENIKITENMDFEPWGLVTFVIHQT